MLVGQVGTFLDELHAIDPDDVPGLTHAARTCWPTWGPSSAWSAVEVRWSGRPGVAQGQPAGDDRAHDQVHGGLRLGNIIMDRGGLAAVRWTGSWPASGSRSRTWVTDLGQDLTLDGSGEVAGIGFDGRGSLTAYKEASREAVDRAALH